MKNRFILKFLRKASEFSGSAPGKIFTEIKEKLSSKLIAAGIFFAIVLSGAASQLNVPTYSDANGRYTISWNMQGLSSGSRLEEYSGSGWKFISTSRSGSKSFDKASDGRVIYRLMECDGEVGCIIEDRRDSVSVQHTPGVPSLTIDNFTDPDGAYTVTWVKPSGTVKTYQLLENNSVVYTGSSRSFSLSSKSDGTYNYKVKACNDVSCSSPSGIKTVTVLKIPTVPQNLTASEAVVKDGTLALSWDASQETVDYYKVIDTSTTIVLKEIAATQVEFANELRNGDHSFAVKACNDTGCSQLSDPVTVSVEMPPEVPAPFVVPDQSQSGRFTITWDTAGLAESTYSDVYRGLNGGELEFYTRVNAPGADETVFTLNERFVEDGTAAYMVIACNEFGCSDFTEIGAVTISLEFSEVVADSPIVNLPVPSNDQPRALTGEGGVSGGKATYSIPLPVPPGRNEMQPSLSLEYSSRGSESRTGLGWSVNDGLGTIYRCARTEAVDGENRPFEQTNYDRLCMNGQPLMLDSGSYGQLGSVYFTEIDNFSRVTLIAGSSLLPGSVFKVERKDGAIELYGDIHANAVDLPTGAQAPFTWYPSKVIDRNGNNIKYIYSNGAEDKKLSKILYTGFNNSSGNREIRFVYPPTAKDHFAYRQGAEIIAKTRLSDIEFFVDGMFSHKIALGYNENSKGQSLLTSLEYCADEDCQNTAKPTYFAYENHEFDFKRVTVSTNSTFRYSVANDYDGDGTRELRRLTYLDQVSPGAPIKNELKISSTGQWVDITDEFYNGFGSSGTFRPMGPASDLNRDGKADVLGHENGYFQIGSFNGTGFTKIVSSLAMSSEGPYIRSVKDFNRDGYLDLLTKESSTVYRVHFRSTNDSPDEINFSGYKEIHLRWDVNVKEVIDAVDDFNGDGLPDLFVIDTEHSLDGIASKSKILFGRRDAVGSLQFDEKTLEFLGASPYFGYTQGDYKLDVNGDGLTDLVTYEYKKDELDSIHLYLNRGLKTSDNFVHYSYGSPVEGLDKSLIEGLKVLDYNNDGKQELMFPGDIVNHYCYTANSTEPGQGDKIGIEYCTNGTGVAQLLTSGYDSENRAIYRWDALGFEYNRWWGIRKVATNLELPMTISTGSVDFNGDGNNDYIYNLNQQYGGYPANPNSDDSTGYWERHRWIGSGAIADATYVMVNKEATTGGFSHSKLTHVYGETVPEHIWDYSTLSGEGSPGCSYGEDRPFYSVNRDPENVAPDHFHFNSSMIVAAEHRVSNGVSPTLGEDELNSTCYYYEDAMYSATGRGFRGFKAIKVEENFADVEHNKATRTEFHDTFPLTGKPKYSEQRLWDEDFSVGNPLSKTETTWSVDSRDNGTYFVYKDEEITRTYDLKTRYAMSTKRTDPIYDEGNDLLYGNPRRTYTWLYTYIDGKHSMTHPTKSVDLFDYSEASSWWINKRIRSYSQPRPTRYYSWTPGPEPNEESNSHKQVIVEYNWATDGSRQLKQTITQSNVTDEKSIKTLEYDSWGNITKESTTVTTDGVTETRSSRVDYTADGYFVDKTYNALDHMTDVAVEPFRGMITETVSPEGVITSKGYDDFGRLLDEQTGTLPAIHYVEEFCVGVCADENPGVVSIHTALSDGTPVTIEYKDLLGRTIKTRTIGFEGDIVTTVSYNARGYKISESKPGYDGDASYYVTYSDFDAQGRYGKKTVDRNGHTHASQVWQYDFIGSRTNIILPDGNLTASRAYDAHGNLFSTTDANGSTTFFRYDCNGDQILIEDVAGNQVIHYFDNLGRNTKIEDPDSGVFTMRYNGFGELIRSEDANGTVFRNEYDALGRTVARYINKGSGEVLDATWVYDVERIGTLSSMISGDGQYREDYAYDEYSRKIKTTTTIEGKIYESETYYDSYYNRVKGKRLPSGEIIAYTFDEFGFLLSEVNPLAPEEDYVYHRINGMDARGNITSEIFGNGLTAVHDFHASTGLVKDVYFDAGPMYLQHFHYEYDDPFGNVTMRSNVVKGVDEIFTYDSLQRLQSSTRHGEVTNYEYDAIGNLMVKSDFATSYAYGDASRSLGGNAGPHAVRQIQHKNGLTFTYNYDANGNLLSGFNRLLIYDPFNKPTRIMESGVTTDLVYAPDLRLYKRENPEQIIYYVSGEYEKVIDKSTGNVSEKSYLSKNAAVEKDENGRELRFMHHDRLTSITAITDGAGNIIEERGFDAFGAPLDAEWRSNSGFLNGDFSDRGFTSHKHMDEHKVIHMDGRLYDPLLGRFFSVDPIIQDPKNTQSQNAYTYVMNNPLSMIDPTGYSGDRVADGEEQTGGAVLGAPAAANSETDNGLKGIGAEPSLNKDIVKIETDSTSLWSGKFKVNDDVEVDVGLGEVNVEVTKEGVIVKVKLLNISAENSANEASTSGAVGIVELNLSTGKAKVVGGELSGTLPPICAGRHCLVVTSEIQAGVAGGGEKAKALDGDLQISYKQRLPPGWEVAKRDRESERRQQVDAANRRIEERLGGRVTSPRSLKNGPARLQLKSAEQMRAAWSTRQAPVADVAR